MAIPRIYSHFFDRVLDSSPDSSPGSNLDWSNSISQKGLGQSLISQLCNSQPLCKITIIWSLEVYNGSLAVHNHIDYW